MKGFAIRRIAEDTAAARASLVLVLTLVACGTQSSTGSRAVPEAGSGGGGAVAGGVSGTGGSGAGGAGRGNSGGSAGMAAIGGARDNGGVGGSGDSGTTAGMPAAGGGGNASGSSGSGATSGAMGAAGTRGGAGQAGASAGMAAAGTSGAGGLGGAAACPSGATAKSGETTETIMVGGMSRTYVLHIPPSYDGKTAMPVIFDYHALGGTGSQQKMLSGWGTLADQKGIIMVWPDGVGNSWNVGRCCSTAQSQNVDDVAFTKAIISALEQKACVDPKRIYATGCSNGGGMAYRIACDAADMIAAVAPVDFDCVTNASATPSCGMCTPARSISEIQFRGTSDTAVPYGGGSGPRGTVFPGAEENFSEWATINACTGEPMPLAGHSSCQAYDQCAGSAETVL
jgi:polyhydroxybutyrate depolymerase